MMVAGCVVPGVGVVVGEGVRMEWRRGFIFFHFCILSADTLRPHFGLFRIRQQHLSLSVPSPLLSS